MLCACVHALPCPLARPPPCAEAHTEPRPSLLSQPQQVRIRQPTHTNARGGGGLLRARERAGATEADAPERAHDVVVEKLDAALVDVAALGAVEACARGHQLHLDRRRKVDVELGDDQSRLEGCDDLWSRMRVRACRVWGLFGVSSSTSGGSACKASGQLTLKRARNRRPPDLRRDIAVEAVDVDLEDVDRRQPGLLHTSRRR